MEVFELRCASINDFSTLVKSHRVDALAGMFKADGLLEHWKHRPAVEFFVEKRLKKQKPRADISFFVPGALVLNKKAHAALSHYLKRFGQLLELQHDDEILYFYNVTNLIDCIDLEHSEQLDGGGIVKETFKQAAIPGGPAIFKDPLTASARIYINEAGKEFFDRLIAQWEITGVECGVPEPF